jgi:hypothetical protein
MRLWRCLGHLVNVKKASKNADPRTNSAAQRPINSSNCQFCEFFMVFPAILSETTSTEV